jgi:hypothetical protein
VDKCTNHTGILLQESEEEDEEKKGEDGEKGGAGRGRKSDRKRKPGARTRRRYSYVNKGYYDSSSGKERDMFALHEGVGREGWNLFNSFNSL